LQMPCRRASAGDAYCVLAVEANAGFEFEGDVALFCCFDEISAREVERCAEALFVAAQYDAYLSVCERSRFLHGSESCEHYDETAFHVGYARAGGDHSIGIGEDGIFLEGTGELKDRVHVADEQEALAAFACPLRTWMLGNQVAGAASDGLHGNPMGFKSESLDARKQDVFDGFHACEVHRAAVDVDDSLEEGLIFCDVRVN
jgi:hypothetical protein